MKELDALISISSDTSDFINTFVELSHDYSLTLKNENKVEIFHVRKSNKSFIYDKLKEFCIGNLCQYVFSRSVVDKNTTRSQIQVLTKKAIDKFRQIKIAESKKEQDGKRNEDLGQGGELGEILLYLFLENRLHAPKLLSKMEIKTTNNQYVYGADGVHLYQTKSSSGKPVYQFILGESKIKNDILDAVRKAFESINTTIDEIDVEQGLISLEIFREVYDKEKAEAIKEFILPKEDISETSAIHERAFGIFIGYSVEFDCKELNSEEWNKQVDAKIRKDIGRAISTIEHQITTYGFDGYSIYIYFLPFNKADDDRKKIMGDIL
jgi:hypothetical protein